ncbi:hypothetical protein ABW20_dc0100432 [Dactylellina cionopaga]|nr:hypothetical protein ABW20_dc0100432 [Dactylellina cionopaga]
MDRHKEQLSYEPTGPTGTTSDGENDDASCTYHQPPRWEHSPPRDRRDFEVAIICALPLEASVVNELFDQEYDEIAYGKARGDSNAYSTGVIGHHNVVLVYMPGIGKVAAATAAASLRASFQEIRLALVVGICGGAPSEYQSGEAILLGDVVISEGLVQYDLGRQYPDSRYMRKDTPHDNLPRPSPEIRASLAKLKTQQVRNRFQKKTSQYLEVLQQKLSNWVVYPGVTEDRLFKSTYQHKHHEECVICANDGESGKICDKAVEMNCEQLKCHKQQLVLRNRVSQPLNPIVHFGLIASGDTVMKSGEDRDYIAYRDGVIAFEMEGAGVWENFPNSLVIKSVCDYADSHKDKKWQGYAAGTAAAATKAFLDNWNTGNPRLLSSHARIGEAEKDQARRAKEIEVLKMLDKSPYRDRKDRNPDRINGTCEWFVGHELFREWQESKSSRTLWVSADPGCGKSVLVKYLVDSVLTTTESRTICYFFFKDDFEDQRSITSALCCILRQLFIQKRILLSEKVLEQFENAGERWTSSFGEVWDAFLSAAKNGGEIVCIFDAIDECEDTGRTQLAQALCKLYNTRMSLNLKFLLTSRPYGGIRQSFLPLEIPGLPVIHLSGESDVEVEKISLEIDIFIKARVQNIGIRLKLERDEQELLLQELTRVPNRTYLWVHLTLDLIESDINIDKNKISRITSDLPKTIDEAYERIISKSQNIEEANKLLQIVVAAARPLTLKEMSLALTLTDDHRSYRDLDLKPEERFREICIQHLLFEEFEAHPLDKDAVISQYTESHIFLDYSARHWTTHLHELKMEVNNPTTESILRLCNTGSKCCFTWFRVYWTNQNIEFPENFSSIMIASYFGLAAVIKLFLESNSPDLNSRDDTYGRSALSWAAGNGFEHAVEQLIGINKSWRKIIFFKEGVQIDSVDRYGRTPLVYAVWNGHVAAIKLLLNAGARVDLEDNVGGTPLSYAICSGNDDVATLLLKNGTEAGSKENIVRALLFSSTKKGDRDVVQLLLETGIVDPDLKDRNGLTPLSWAIQGNDERIVALLLENGAGPELEDEYGWRPLSRAVERGNAAILQLLLAREIETNFVYTLVSQFTYIQADPCQTKC